MSETRNIEIELDLGNNFSKEEVLAIKKELMQAIPGLEVRLKEYPPIDGHMNFGGIDLDNIVVFAACAAAIEAPLHAFADFVWEILKSKMTNVEDEKMGSRWIHNITASFKSNKERKDYIIGSDRKFKEWNFKPYIIDPNKTYVVLVGCSEYKYGITAIPPVNGNIHDIYNLLIDKRVFGISRDHIEICFNKESHDIQNLLYAQSRKAGIETFIFYYAGHGFSTLNGDYALAAADTEKQGDFINSGIEKKFIEKQILENSPAHQKIVIVDACYSGILTQSEIPQIFDSVMGTYILASSGSSEVSLFDKDSHNTYFTTALLEILNSGVPTERETITLEDLFNYTSEWLLKKKLPRPAFKSGLSIPPSAFSISQNPSFSYENEKNKIELLISQGKLTDASYLLKRMRQKFPDNMELKEQMLSVDNDIMFSDLVIAGDTAYLREQDYATATDRYEKALELKNDLYVKDKLNKCIRLLNSGNVKSASSHMEQGESMGVKKTIVKTTEKNKLIKKIAVGFVIAFIATLSVEFVLHKLKNKKEEPDAKTDTSTIQKIANIPVSLPADTAKTNQTSESQNSKNPLKIENNKINYTDSTIKQVTSIKDQKNNESIETGLTSLYSFLNGSEYEEDNTLNALSFGNITVNKISYSGSISDYNVSGKFRLTKNGMLITLDGNLLTDNLKISDDTHEISGNVKIKNKSISVHVILKKK